MLSCESCKNFKNNYFVEHLQTAGSETPLWVSLFNKVAGLMTVSERECLTQVFLCEFCEIFRKVFLQNTF